MSRPSGNADRLMIEAGKKIAREEGCSFLRIREIVDRAHVNLGMFHYHFKNRKNFVRVLLSEVYGEFFSELTKVTHREAESIDQLRESLILMGVFLHRNRKIAMALLRDLLNGDPDVLKYNRKRMPPHAEFIKELMLNCQREGSLPKISPHQIMPLFLGAIVQPVFIAEIMEKMEKSDHQKPFFDFNQIMSKRAIAQRVDILLGGMRSMRVKNL